MFIEGAVEPSYYGYFRVTKLIPRFSEALRLVDKLEDEAASEDYSAIEGAFGAGYIGTVVRLSANEQDVLL